MEHQKLNRIIAAVIFVIAFVVYSLTVAPTTSYWDCGEFITSSFIMGVPHPPGAPLYILLGRVFSIIPFVQDIGLRVNMISVLLSALTVMFAYLIVVRLLRAWRGLPKSMDERIVMYTGGIIGALGIAFSDSFWFNAVEAEVYAVSMFFTAIVVWLMLVWVEKADNPASDKILLLIAYLLGLATGIHLLNILAIPTLFLIFYFRKGDFKLKTFVLWSIAAGAAFGMIYPVMVKGIPWVISNFSFLALGLIVLAVFSGIVYSIRENKRVLNIMLMGIMLVAMGYSTYTALYIRSGLKPAINENHPDTPAKLVSYLNREQYGDIPMNTRRAPMWEYQLKKMYVRYFGWQFIGHGTTIGSDNYVVETISLNGLMGLPFLIGMIGMFHHFRSDWKRASAMMVLFIMTGVAITIYLNQENPQPRERDYAYVGSFFAFALWIGIGASALLELTLANIKENAALKKIGLAGMIALLLFAVPINLFSFNRHNHDRSGNYVAYDYSYNILQTCEKGAILFTNGDNDTFPLWFLQYVYGIRTDVRVVNLSLLNTPWYIKQLRDEEPRVPISYTDGEIDQLQARLWDKPRNIRIDVSRSQVVNELAKASDNSGIGLGNIPDSPALAFELKNTKVIQGHPVILVQDIMVLHIIAANKFKRPVYFAVTVASSNMLGMNNPSAKRNERKNFLRMDGLAFKVMPYAGPGDFISQQRIQENVFDNFQYRNLDNPDVFYNRNVMGLLQNYRSAFLRLANHYLFREKTNEKALKVLDKMEEVLPESIIRLRDYQLSLSIGRMYAEAGRPEELERRLDSVLRDFKMSSTDKVMTAEFYRRELNNEAKAESLARSVLEDDPSSVQSRSWLVGFYAEKKQYAKGAEILNDWLERQPNDKNARQQLSNLMALAKMDSVTDSQSAPVTEGQ